MKKGIASGCRRRGKLPEDSIDTVRRWISQGAKDDTPASATIAAIDAEHPPRYVAPPVVTALDHSPDGKLLAVAGYHEILLYDTKSHQLNDRLIGLSRTDSGVGLLAGRQTFGRGCRFAGTFRRGANLGRGQTRTAHFSPVHFRHALWHELVARWQDGRLRRLRQRAAGD